MIPLTRCPMATVSKDAVRVTRIHAAWEKGITPTGGGYLDQANTLVEAIGLLSSEYGKWQEAKMERMRGE